MVNEVRKPRRTRGTPLYRIRSYFGLGVFGVAILSGLLFHKSVGGQKLRTWIEDMLLEGAEETRFKREMMKEFFRTRSRDDSE